MLRTFISRLLLGAFVFSLFGMQVHAQDADDLVQRLQAKYDQIDALRASFTQTLRYPGSSDDGEQFSGTVVLRGQQYRVETGAQTLVTDAQTTWIYSPSEGQVIVNAYREDETAFSLNNFLLNFGERYDVRGVETVTYEGGRHFKLTLAPRSSDTFFEEVRVWLRDRDDVVTRLEIDDVNDTQMTYQLKNIELNPAVSDQTFTFDPPASAEVIDLR